MVDSTMSNVPELPEIMSDAEAKKEQEAIEQDLPGLIHLIKEDYYIARTGRTKHENRWRQAFKDFRGDADGNYNDIINQREKIKSRVFIKIAKTKTLAAYGQLVEVVFAGNRFPIGVKPTEVPTGIAERAHYDPQAEAEVQPEFDFGYAGDGEGSSLDPVLGGLGPDYNDAPFVAGQAPDPKMVTIKPAEISAKNMEKEIHDQMTEAHAARELRSAMFESCLYGTGIIKGPYNYYKILHKWNIDTPEDGEKFESKRSYAPEEVLVPRLDCVSVWDAFPDPNAHDDEDFRFMIERHMLNSSQLRDLLKRPFFNREGIRRALEAGPSGTKLYFETDDVTDNDTTLEEDQLFEVLEYWGSIDFRTAVEAGLDLGEDEFDALDEVQINAWVCGENIIRLVVNPFQPERIPYKFFPYERLPHSVWGIGVPENMADSTMLMNGHMRFAIDNLALSGNVIFDIDDNALVPGQSTDIYPGKVFHRTPGEREALRAINIPNTTNENIQMYEVARRLADEATGIPSYAHGQTGHGTTRTASGMSMLMGAAALNIKTAVKNLDDYLLKPLGEEFYFWNMQFNDRIDIKGDLDIKALGTEAVMQKEVRSQRLTQFLQVAANPATAPFVKLDKIIKELAIALELDPEDIVNDPDQAKLFAQIIGSAGGVQSPQAGQQQPEGGAGPINTGSTGNGDGTVGTGEPPLPGEKGFSGNV